MEMNQIPNFSQNYALPYVSAITNLFNIANVFGFYS